MIFELNGVSRIIEKTKCVGMTSQSDSVFSLHFLKLLEIAISDKKHFSTFLIQVCTHLLSVIDGVF